MVIEALCLAGSIQTPGDWCLHHFSSEEQVPQILLCPKRKWIFPFFFRLHFTVLTVKHTSATSGPLLHQFWLVKPWTKQKEKMASILSKKYSALTSEVFCILIKKYWCLTMFITAVDAHLVMKIKNKEKTTISICIYIFTCISNFILYILQKFLQDLYRHARRIQKHLPWV